MEVLDQGLRLGQNDQETGRPISRRPVAINRPSRLSGVQSGDGPVSRWAASQSLGLASCLIFWPKPIRVYVVYPSLISAQYIHSSPLPLSSSSSHLHCCPRLLSSPLLPSVSQLLLLLSSPPFRLPASPPSLPAALPLFLTAAAASVQLCKGGKGSAALFFYNFSLAAAASKTRKGSAAAR